MWPARRRRVLRGFSELRVATAVTAVSVACGWNCCWRCSAAPLILLAEAGPPQVNWRDVLEQLAAALLEHWRSAVLFVCVTRINATRFAPMQARSSCRVIAPRAVYNESTAEEERKGWVSLVLRICEPGGAGLANRMPLARLIWAFPSVWLTCLSVCSLIIFQPAASKAASPIVQNSCRVASQRSGGGDVTGPHVFSHVLAACDWGEMTQAVSKTPYVARRREPRYREGPAALEHWPTLFRRRLSPRVFLPGAFNQDFLFLFVAERRQSVRMKHLAWRRGSEWTKNESAPSPHPPTHRHAHGRAVCICCRKSLCYGRTLSVLRHIIGRPHDQRWDLSVPRMCGTALWKRL